MLPPNTQQLHWNFKNEFLFAPAQKMARFAPRCATEIVRSRNDFQNIDPQVDGYDYNPTAQTTLYRPLPFVNWNSERVGFQLWGHTWNFALATEELNMILPSFRTTLAMRARESWERFTDRIMAGAADLKRSTVDSANPGRLGDGDLSKLNLPDTYRVANKNPANDTSALQLLGVDLLIDMAETFAAAEVGDYSGSGNGMAYPVCVARHEQIFNLLRQEKYINRDYTSQIPLIRGDFNLYMGFEFIRTPAVDSWDLPPTYIAGTKAAVTGTDIKSAATANYTQITTADVSRVLFAHPHMAFAKGIYPQAGYMQVWQNPIRAGTIEYLMKNVLAWKRKQNEYVRMAYVAKRTDAAAAPIKKKPLAGNQINYQYEQNRSRNAGWDIDLALS